MWHYTYLFLPAGWKKFVRAVCFWGDRFSVVLAFGGAVNFTEPSGSTRPLPEEAELFFILCSGSTMLKLSDDITVSLTMRVVEGSGPRDEGLFAADSVELFCLGSVFSGVSPTVLIPLVTTLQM